MNNKPSRGCFMIKTEKRKKVVFFVSGFIVGGVETVFVNTIEALLKNPNLEISIVTHMKLREALYADWLKSHPEIPVYTYFPLGNWFQDLEPKCHGILKPVRRITFSLYKRYRRFIWRNKFKNMDVLIDYKNGEFYRELSYVNKPKVTWFHSALCYFERDINFLKKIPRYTKIVCLTEDFKKKFNSKYPAYSDKLVHIYNPINVKHIQQLSKQGKSPRCKYFCHVSRLDRGKDIKTLLDAFELFYKSHKDVKLYIIGDGPLANTHKSYASTLKSSKNIIFTGTQYNPYVFMKGALANILSTEFEGLPTVVLESVALEVPCISADCESGPREILLDGKGGLLFEIGNSKQLCEHMLNVYSGNIDKENMIKNMKKSISRFTSSVIAQQIYEMIQNLIKEKENEKNI